VVDINVARQLGTALNGTLLRLVSVAGPMEPSAMMAAESARRDLQSNLRRYDVLARRYQESAVPEDEQLEKWVRDNYPSDYVNKRYKMKFVKMLYRYVPFFKGKQRTEDKLRQRSLLALQTFKILFNQIAVLSAEMLKRSDAMSVPADAEGFEDDEQAATTEALERELRIDRIVDNHQKQTQQGAQRKLRNKQPAARAKNDQQFQQLIRKYVGAMEGPRNVLMDYKDDLTAVLAGADTPTFNQIRRSAASVTTLALALSRAATAAKEDLQPGTYVACKGFLYMAVTLTQIITESASFNRKQRSEMQKKIKDYESKIEHGEDELEGLRDELG
jgi:hypothetical protein